MSEARGEILSKIRTTRTSPNAAKNILGTMQARIRDHSANLIPERGQRPADERVAQFMAEATRVNATVTRVAGNPDIPREVARFLTDNNLPSRIKQAPSLAHLDWSETMLTVSQGVGDAADEVCVTSAFGGVAETGTLVTYSAAENPTTLNFLPPVHVVVLKSKDITGAYEDIWVRLREALKNKDQSDNFMPRAVNFITGPSRTGDIQQTLLLGIHGPQRLHIVIVDDKTP
ncbi:MAG: lactate utilization protein [Rhodospirillales bacterium]|nr:lactate utilization protein [Rhodospirillales bacterium]